uniref:Uncharacterized protein n=1 Tax=Panthera tigris altaica TaxID=74533 RepID=A0A8C9J4H8_PANTA
MLNSLCSPSLPALTEGYVGALHENRHGSSAQIRRRKASGDPYWAYSGEFMCSNQDHIAWKYVLWSHWDHLKIGYLSGFYFHLL